MKYKTKQYQKFKRNLSEIASRYNLNPDNLIVEFFTLNCQAILVEHVDEHDYKIHINLEEDRIVSIQPMDKAAEQSHNWREKYRHYMK